VQHQQRVRRVANRLKKILSLLQTVAAGAEVIPAPKEPSVLGPLSRTLVGRVDSGLALRGLIDHSKNAVRLGSFEIWILVVMRKVNDNVQGCHFTPLLILLKSASSCQRLSVADAYGSQDPAWANPSAMQPEKAR